MRKTLKGIKKTIRESVIASAFLGLSSVTGHAQTIVQIEYQGEPLQVIAMDGDYPVVDAYGERTTVYEGRVQVSETAYFTDGAIEILGKQAGMAQQYGSAAGTFFFRFDASISADRDFQDCFILFVISPESGEASHVIRQISDIDATENSEISVTIPVNPGFGGGTFGYKIYSAGEEIEVLDPEDTNISVARPSEEEDSSTYDPNQSNSNVSTRSAPRQRSTSSRMASSLPTVAGESLLEFPQSLIGVLQGGYAEAVFSIDESGNAFELLDLKVDNAAFIGPTVHAVINTKYRPGELGGEPLVTTVKRRFLFNEFVSFSEGLELIPYPTIQDREAMPVYSPISTKAPSGVVVEIAFQIDTLGRQTSIEVLKSPNEELGAAASEAAESWVFLPAIRNGIPVESRIVIPIRFNK